MHVYGLTGGIGTGKSTIAKMLAAKGAVIVDADAIAREVVAPGSEGLQAIVAQFGPGVLDAEGRLDRVRLGNIVFADGELRRKLEAITHPRILMLMGLRIAAAAEEGRQVVILDVPLLYETGAMEKSVEKVILAYAPAALQLQRVGGRDGLEAEQIKARMGAQIDIEAKKKRADFVIDNSGALDETRRQVDALWPVLTGEK
jgi:dephospho-CoA kinase